MAVPHKAACRYCGQRIYTNDLLVFAAGDVWGGRICGRDATGALRYHEPEPAKEKNGMFYIWNQKTKVFAGNPEKQIAGTGAYGDLATAQTDAEAFAKNFPGHTFIVLERVFKVVAVPEYRLEVTKG